MVMCFFYVFSVGWWDDGEVVGWLINVSDELRSNRKTVMKGRRLAEANHRRRRHHLHRHPHRPHLRRRHPPPFINGTINNLSSWNGFGKTFLPHRPSHQPLRSVGEQTTNIDGARPATAADGRQVARP